MRGAPRTGSSHREHRERRESCPLYRHAISSVSSVGSVAMFFSLHTLVCPLYICLSGLFLFSSVRAVRDERFDSFGFIQSIYLPRAVAQDEMVLLSFIFSPVNKLDAQTRACFAG